MIAGTAGTAAAERPPVYEMVDLGRLGFVHDPDGRTFTGSLVPGTFDVNNHDQVAYARAFDDGAGGTVVKPFLFLLEPAYGLPAGSHPILDVFGSAIPDSEEGAAFDINDAGVVVGQVGGSGFFEGRAHAWILDPTDTDLTVKVLLPLPVPGPDDPPFTWSRAVSISETAPWTIVVQTSVLRDCPTTCKDGAGARQEHVQSYLVTLAADGTPGTPVLLAGDVDCEAAVGAWGVAADATVAVGSDRRITETPCAEERPELCATDESGLRWGGGGSPADLVDFDGAGPDVRWSLAKDVGLDGLAVGYGVDDNGITSCASRALLWAPSGAIDTNLHDVPIDAAAYPPGDEPLGLDSELESSAAGRNDAPARTIAGWDEGLRRGVLWYETTPGSGEWRVMFPGVDGPTYSPGSVIDGSCEGPSGTNAEVRFLYDVNDRQAAVGRAQFAPSDPESHEHLVLLVPRDGCTQADTDRDGDVDFDDLLAVLNAFDLVCPNCALCPADVDGSGVVDFHDLLTVIEEWTEDCVTFIGPPQSVQDCWERYGSNLEAFEACVETLTDQ